MLTTTAVHFCSTQVGVAYKPTTPEQERQILDRIFKDGSTFSRGPGYCAADVSETLEGIGLFQDIDDFLNIIPYYLYQDMLELLR